MTAQNISIVGLGTLGTQIAIQAAAYGHRVSGYDPDAGAFARMQVKVRDAMRMTRKGPTFAVAEWETHASKVELHRDLAGALANADLVVEVVTEDLAIKRAVFAEIDRLAPPHALLATNSSTLPVSRIESATGRPERCVNIHFYQPAVGMNMADVMGGTRTSAESLQAAREFVRSVGCVPLAVQKEILGFCFNSIWRAVKRQSLYMWANGFVDFRDVDRAWMVFTGMTYGPFFLMDLVGLDVIYAVEQIYFKDSGDPRDEPPALLKAKVDRGELGVKSGRGFYAYPEPECAGEGFLHDRREQWPLTKPS
ncbi:MAG: 3-hydroxyacyl-CoA dehydrogenase NAD-binding domain-containing protein [Pseudomonadota bacterium]|nr:3-hydroxyacyl-CoA dehydrogenase NAD-binding domain-containing protein [Pseudomonadota bacterium]